MTHTPAVDSLEQLRHKLDALRIALVVDGDEWGANDVLADAIATLTRPRGGSERLLAFAEHHAVALESIAAKFRSGNDVEVERASITRAEWEAVCAYVRDQEAIIDDRDEALAALASPQGAEQRQEGGDVIVGQIGDYGALESREWATVIYDDKKIAECYTNEDAELVGAALRAYADPRQEVDHFSFDAAYEDFVTKRKATPHPEPAATQGDAVAYQSLVEAVHCFNVRADAGDKAAAEYWRAEVNRYAAALSSPTGVQAAQVSDAWTDEQCAEFLSVAFRHCNIDGTFKFDDIRLGQRRANALAQPGSAAHGREARANNGDPDTIVPAPSSRKRPPHEA